MVPSATDRDSSVPLAGASPTDLKAFWEQDAQKDLLRFLTAGSVDDGKSTLIGRLLHDTKLVYEDQLAALRRDSARRGSAGGLVDYSLLLDGLKAEREQGITIDVAYRYFSTPRRKFIIADTPGHEQYTRNMVTGASTCDLAIILIDARNGIRPQTRRHSFIASLLGIKHLVIAVNKMDAVDYRRDVFEAIRQEYADFATRLEVTDIHFIPISALQGDNVVERSTNMPWFRGAELLDYLETVHVASDRNLIDLRFPVQYVTRPHQDFRGFCGTVASGIVRRGDPILVLPSGRQSRVRSIHTFDGDRDEAFAAMAVTLTLEDEVDVSRGDILVHPRNVPRVDNHFEAMLVWMAESPMPAGGDWLLKLGTQTVPASVSGIRYRINVNTLHREPASQLALNEIGRVRVDLRRPAAFDAYRRNRSTGAFILIDRLTNGTVASGMILEHEAAELVGEGGAARQRAAAGPLREHRSLVQADDRRTRLRQQPATVWLTGLPKAGKSTIAYALEKRLFDLGGLPFVLDGENIRLGVSADLSFSADDRSENVRRAAQIARLLNEAGLVVLVALVSPYREDREKARQIIGAERFLEVHVEAPVEVCEARDQDGLYARARRGEIRLFSGVTAPYEPPAKPALHLPTAELEPAAAVDRILDELRRRGIVP